MADVSTSIRNFFPVKIGGGGYITSHDIHTDGTFVCRTDVFGAYLWNAANSEWVQLVTSASMPAGDVHVDYYAGCYEIAIAPSNSSIFYMVYLGYVYKSTNKGTTWTVTGFTRDATMLAGDTYRFVGQRLAIDPLDPNVVYLGTQTTGLWYTRNGGTSWTQVASGTIPFGDIVGSSYPGIMSVIIDPYASAVSGRSGTIWASSCGNGDYLSTDGGDTWSLPASGTTNGARRMTFAADGQLYVAGFSTNNCYRWDGSWHSIAKTSIHDILCDPFDAAHIIVCEGSGRLAQSADRGATFTGVMGTWTQNNGGTGDIPWFEWAIETAASTYMAIGRCSFHPTTQNKLLMSAGIGLWALSSLSPSALSGFQPNWVSQTNGIEELVANQILATPNGDLFLASWDRTVWKITNPNAFPAATDAYYIPPTSTTPVINHCWAMDWASSEPDFLVALISGQNFNTNYSVYSSDAGATWTIFAAMPTEGATYKGSGCVAASTPLNWVVQPSTNSASIGPSYTLDGGATWGACALEGSPGFINAFNIYYLNRFIVCADRVAANTFYYFNGNGFSGHVYRSTDGGANFAKMTASAIVTANSSIYHTKLKSVPGKEGHLWFTSGPAGDLSDYETPAGAFKRSTDSGATFSTIANVLEVFDFCFGAAASGATYPTIYINGWVNGEYGIYYSTDECANFTKIGDWPLNSIDWLKCMDADKSVFGKLYVGFNGSGFAYTAGSITGTRGLQF